MAKDMNLDEMSLTELKKLRKDVDKAITGYEHRRRREAIAAAEAAAKDKGFSLADLTGDLKKTRRSATGKQQVKYRHPENPELTWSGRGRQPAWFREATESGTPREDLEAD